MDIFTIPNGPFMVNTYLLVLENSKALIIDPGADLDMLFDKIESDSLKPEAVIATHGHIDHVGGVQDVKDRYKIPFYLNKDDEFLVQQLPTQARFFGVENLAIPEVDHKLPSDEVFSIGDFSFECLHTPGHSPGSISFKFDTVVFTGDAIFQGAIGRTDLPGGSMNTLLDSIKNKLLSLPGDTVLYPGHGSKTTVQDEKRMNPYLQ